MTRPLALLCLVFALASCDEEADATKRKNRDGGTEGPDGEDPNVPKCSGPEVGKEYVGFGATPLHGDRLNNRKGVDRGRMKPYSALRGEYERVIGVTPESLGNAEVTFGRAPERFATEPRASAIQLFTAYRIGFDGCLTFVDKPTYAAAPTAASAKQECASMARKFWGRAASEAELKACTDVALTDSASEPSAKRRWAYTCASLLSSAPFLTY